MVMQGFLHQQYLHAAPGVLGHLRSTGFEMLRVASIQELEKKARHVVCAILGLGFGCMTDNLGAKGSSVALDH